MRLPSTKTAVRILVVTLAIPTMAHAKDSEYRQGLMTQLARDKDPEVRADAAQMLGKLKVAEAVPVLTSALADADSHVRACAAAALWRLAPASRPAVPALEKALDDRSPRVRLDAAGALNALDAGTPAKLVAVLGALLADAELAQSAAEVLVSRDLENADVRRYLLEGLSRGDMGVRKAIVDGMAEARLAGEAAIPYAPRLAEAMHADKAWEVRLSAVRWAAAAAPPPKEVAAALQGALKDENAEVRQAAARALNSAGAEAQRSAVEEAVRAGRDGSAEDVGRLVDAVEQAAALAPVGAEGLIRTLRAGATDQERSAAAEALGAMSAYADPAGAALSQALHAEASPTVRVTIASALHSLDGTMKSEATVIAALVQALEKDPDPSVREEAALALGVRARRSPQAALPALKAAQRDPARGVREAAEQAIVSLGRH